MLFQRVFEDIFQFEIVIASVVFVLVSAALLAALLLSRWKKADTRKRDSHPWIEGGYAVLLAGIAGVIVYVTASAHSEIQQVTNERNTAAAPASRVQVDAFQWCWRFDYPHSGKSVTGVCGEDNTKLPTLVVPAGEPVKLSITSTDVIHAFWIPDLGVKIDAMPDHTNTLTLTFEEGRWLGRCSEFCGPYHPSMHFWVRAVPQEQYQQFLHQGTTV